MNTPLQKNKKFNYCVNTQPITEESKLHKELEQSFSENKIPHKWVNHNGELWLFREYQYLSETGLMTAGYNVKSKGDGGWAT